MDRLGEIIHNTNGYLLLSCAIYSFICGCIFPEIWDKIYDRKKTSRLAIIQLVRSVGSWVLVVVFCCLPGQILAWTLDNRDYGGVSLLCFVIGWCVRGLLHNKKIEGY